MYDAPTFITENGCQSSSGLADTDRITLYHVSDQSHSCTGSLEISCGNRTYSYILGKVMLIDILLLFSFINVTNFPKKTPGSGDLIWDNRLDHNR